MEDGDYPRTAADFEARFRSEQACREYLFQLRWPEGFRCPRCGSAKAWPLRSVLRQCAGCGRQVSLTAGTVFQDTHTPLTVWFQAMWWVLPACPAGGGRRTNNLRINRSKHRGETTTGRGHLSQVDTHNRDIKPAKEMTEIRMIYAKVTVFSAWSAVRVVC